MKKLHEYKCVRCDYKIDDRIHEYSTKEMGYSLCFKCQNWLKNDIPSISKYAKLFALELQFRNINLELEKYDGHKHIDIAIPSLFINLEIDGSQHYTKTEQCLADIKRTCRSLEKGFVTIRIPNILIEELDNRIKTADEIVTLLQIRKRQNETQKQQQKIGTLLKEFYENKLLNIEI